MTNDGWLSRLKTSKIFLNKIIEICFRYKVDVIIGTTHGYNIQLAKIKTGVKKVGCEHLNYKAAPWYSRILRRLAYSKLDAVVCLTKKDSEKYSFVNKNKGKKFVISKSLNIFRFIKNWNIYYLYPIKKIINTHRKNAKKITNGSNVTNYVAIVREPPQRIYGFPKTCCTEFIYHTFENCEFRIPKNYDALLQSFYGDYMKLPPKEAQVNAHGLTAYFVEK